MPDGSLIKPNHIILDQNLSDPSKMIYGDINSEAIQWIRANSHRYLGKYTGEGQMTICQLSDTNPDGYVAFHDGSLFLQGNEGDGLCDWWMRLPKFYYHAEEIGPDIWDIGFGEEPEADDWKEWDGKDLIGVFTATNETTKDLVSSRRNILHFRDVPQSKFKIIAADRGVGYSLVKFKHHSMMAFLFYAMYGNTNSRSICGFSIFRYNKITGQTDLLGMTDTVADDKGNIDSSNFWGLEDWLSEALEFVDNVSANNYVWTITEDDGSTRDVQAGTSSGYISKVSVGENLDMVPIDVGASKTTGFCEYYSEEENKNNPFVMMRGGLSYALFNCDASFNSSSRGSRLAFRGDIIVESDVQTFRSIPITNLPIG